MGLVAGSANEHDHVLSDGWRVSARHRLAAVATIYALYLLVYFVVGGAAFEAANHFWHELPVTALTAWLILRCGRNGGPAVRGFLFGVAASLAPLMVADASYGRDFPLWRDQQGAALQLTDAAYAAFLFVWVCAWAALVLNLVHSRRPSGRTVAVFALLMGGFMTLFVGFYAPLYRDVLGTLVGRVGAITAALELLAVIAGMAAMLLGVNRALVLQVFGVTLLASSDMLYNEASMRQQAYAAADPVWTLGLCLLLAGAVLLPRLRRRETGTEFGPLSLGTVRRSGLSTLLLSISLGAVLLSAVVSLSLRRGVIAGVPGAGEPFFYVLFVVTLVVVMVALTERFDRAVQHAERHAAHMLGAGLRMADWRTGDRTLAWIFEATGLGHLLDSLQAAGARLRNEVIFLGPERLNPTAQQETASEPTCFIVMPFGQSDSDAVHHVLREACLACGLQPLRGDDLFTPTDILDDIWRGITGASCVIADISGRNANVMYELGMAHTLAKPVIILSRHAEDIPIDLSTRRVILYGTAQGDDWQAVLAQRTRSSLQALLQQFPPRRPHHRRNG